MDFRPSHEGGDKRSITLPLFHFQIPQMQQTPVSEPQAAQQFNLIKLLLPVATETLNFASASAALARLGSAFPSRNFTRDYWLTLSYLGVSCSILITFSLNLSLQTRADCFPTSSAGDFRAVVPLRRSRSGHLASLPAAVPPGLNSSLHLPALRRSGEIKSSWRWLRLDVDQLSGVCTSPG